MGNYKTIEFVQLSSKSCYKLPLFSLESSLQPQIILCVVIAMNSLKKDPRSAAAASAFLKSQFKELCLMHLLSGTAGLPASKHNDAEASFKMAKQHPYFFPTLKKDVKPLLKLQKWHLPRLESLTSAYV